MGEPNRKWKELFGSEWPKIYELSRCFSDPEQQREFLEVAKQKKLQDPHWSINDDYPEPERTTEKAMNECCNHIKSLRRPRTAPVVREEERTREQEDMALIVELGGHYNPLCLWPRRKEYA